MRPRAAEFRTRGILAAALFAGAAALVLLFGLRWAGSEADRDRVFLPFERLDHARDGQIPGTGLGLALARQGVENSGGTVRAEGSDLGGARLVVEFAAGG